MASRQCLLPIKPPSPVNNKGTEQEDPRDRNDQRNVPTESEEFGKNAVTIGVGKRHLSDVDGMGGIVRDRNLEVMMDEEKRSEFVTGNAASEACLEVRLGQGKTL